VHKVVGRDSGGFDLYPNLAGPRFREILFRYLQHLRPAMLRHDDAMVLPVR
jgi:hypothetical protein